MKEDEANGPPNREMYALLHLSPDAPDEEVHRAQVYHLDKYQAPHMKETATENFQRIFEAYKILSDENKRQIYDIHGMEGLNSGLELGPKLNKLEEIKEQLEKLRLKGNFGGMVASTVFRHGISSTSSIELIGSVGLHSIIGVQTTQQLSLHSTTTMAIPKSLHDGSINLSNSWSHQLFDKASGNIELVLSLESSIMVGWKMKEDNMSAGGDVNFGTHSFGIFTCYTHRCSLISCSTSLEVEISGGRKVLNFSTIRMLYTIGIRGIFWKLELHRGSQKLIIPVRILMHFNYVLGTRAFKFIFKPYYLENIERTATEVFLSECIRIPNFILRKANDELVLQMLNVTLSLNFLVNDLRQLKLDIMGFCDPCPGEPKQLHVEYTYCGDRYEVVVDDYEELQIPQLVHKI
ncbi:hypothetical protein GOBAR_DD02785 [Gossypium barbadense]|nr:hypothetical protein GOBAR_DD02785 [Gossypium barbadense]